MQDRISTKAMQQRGWMDKRRTRPPARLYPHQRDQAALLLLGSGVRLGRDMEPHLRPGLEPEIAMTGREHRRHIRALVRPSIRAETNLTCWGRESPRPIAPPCRVRTCSGNASCAAER